MAKKTESVAEPSENKKRDYSKRRWMIPSKRAKGYAEERKKAYTCAERKTAKN